MIIYITINLINYKIYIGQDSHDNPSYLGSGKILKNAIKLHGKENFKKGILCRCSSKEEMNEKEKYYIKLFNSTDLDIGYNIHPGGNAAHNPAKLHGKNNPFYRKEHSPEVIETIRKANIGNKNAKGHIKTPKGREKIRQTHLGKKQSTEHAKKSAESRKGIKMPDHVKEILKKINTGRPLLQETKNKLSLSMKGRKPINKNKPHYGFRKLFSISDKLLIYIMFTIDNMKMSEICKYFNVSTTPLYKVLDELNLKSIKSIKQNN
jgi:hypothetical protein